MAALTELIKQSVNAVLGMEGMIVNKMLPEMDLQASALSDKTTQVVASESCS